MLFTYANFFRDPYRDDILTHEPAADAALVLKGSFEADGPNDIENVRVIGRTEIVRHSLDGFSIPMYWDGEDWISSGSYLYNTEDREEPFWEFITVAYRCQEREISEEIGNRPYVMTINPYMPNWACEVLWSLKSTD